MKLVAFISQRNVWRYSKMQFSFFSSSSVNFIEIISVQAFF